MMTKAEKMHDPGLYDSLNEGFSSPGDAEAAVRAFWTEVRELRKKHGIPDVLVVCRFGLKGAGDAFMTMSAGCELHAENMAAFALGQAAADRMERVSRMIGEAKKATSQR